jgi:archaeal cell division control protein 6
MCIIAISNNVMSDYEIDDRVRSRIGTSEVFFEPYKSQAVLEILKDRAEKAFSGPIDSEILQFCSDQSSKEHGDARRAIDLLRIAAEIAGKGEEKISKKHVDEAVGQLQKDRISTTLSSASYHLKLAAAALARISYLTEEVWHSTSTLYDQYRHIMSRDGKPLTYRRFSELLTELENMGLVVSHTSSKGRHGYGTQYRLVSPPEVVGKVCFPDWWIETVRKKKQHETDEELGSLFAPKQRSTNSSDRRNNSSLGSILSSLNEGSWREFVGSD